MKRYFILISSLILFIPKEIYADSYGTIETDSCSVTWTYTESDSTLRIEGTGHMPDYQIDSSPWNDIWGNTKSVIYGQGIKSVGANSFSSIISVPESVSITLSETVERINDYAFYICGTLTDIYLPEGLINIGSMAFSTCIALTELSIPSTVTNIGDDAFNQCTHITKYTVADGNERYKSVDGIIFDTSRNALAAFPMNSGRTEYTIPEGIEIIASGAFGAIQDSMDLTLPSTLTTLETIALANFTKLKSITTHAIEPPTAETSSLRIVPCYVHCGSVYKYKSATGWKLLNIIMIDGNGTTGDIEWDYNIETQTLTFSGSGAMAEYEQRSDMPWYDVIDLATNIVIEDGVTNICDSCFNHFSALTDITIPASVTSIGNAALYGCTSLKNITIDTNNTNYSSDSNTLIDNNTNTLIIYAITNEQTEIVIPEGVTTISSEAFTGATNLQKVTLPSTLTGIGDNAFDDCTSITTMVSLAMYPPSLGSQALTGIDRTTATLYVPIGTKTTYSATTVWKKFATIIELDESAINNITATDTYEIFGNKLIINDSNAQWSVYDLNGRCIASNSVSQPKTSVTLQQNGIYILSIDGNCLKITIK